MSKSETRWFSRPGAADPYEEPTRPLHPIVYRLRKLRYERGVSVPRMAKDLGYDETTIKRVERGAKNPSMHLLTDWAAYLGARLELSIDP